MNSHKLHECNEPNCYVCNGGLAFCTVCGGAEATLPTECPGTRMTDEQQMAVQNKELNFESDAWRKS